MWISSGKIWIQGTMGFSKETLIEAIAACQIGHQHDWISTKTEIQPINATGYHSPTTDGVDSAAVEKIGVVLIDNCYIGV